MAASRWRRCSCPTSCSSPNNNIYKEERVNHTEMKTLVLDSLDDMMEESGVVTIADLYSAAELSCPYTAYYYGWTDISSTISYAS